MNRTYFDHKLTKKYIVIVGSLFSDYHILKDGTFIKIPVSYGGKNKIIERYKRRDISLKGVQMTLPRIAFDFKDFYYDNERKLNRIHQYVSSLDDFSKNKQYSPVPYNIDVELSIVANKNDDAAQIIEQILPRFTPDLKITSNLIPENDIILDISLCINNVYKEDTYEGLMTDDRLITWNLGLTLKGYYFKEIDRNKIILQEVVNFFEWDSDIPFANTIITANTI